MNITRLSILSLFVLLAIMIMTASFVSAETESEAEIKAKIDERNEQIKKLEEEIKVYNTEVMNASREATSLNGAIKTLDLTKKKITKDITLTENKINVTELTIDQLDVEIDRTQNHITLNREAIIDALQDTHSIQDLNIIQLVLSKRDISEIWKDVDYIRQTRDTVREKTSELTALKSKMEQKLESLTGQKKNLLNLKKDLSGKKQTVEYTTKEKATILAKTKSREATYKALLKTKQEQKEQFEKELFEYESQLDYAVDRGSYPKPRNGILSWPLESIFITQKFGKTVAARKLYVSGSHNGMDFRAPLGTKLLAVLDGVVVGTGNTDAYPGCYSFGKWVMIKHDNGLSTIYAHLSVISVTSGQRLSTGDLVGYSGNTGYSTGPHLHIGLYATQGVRIERYTSSRGCQQATIPLADLKAYLDPLEYFPNL